MRRKKVYSLLRTVYSVCFIPLILFAMICIAQAQPVSSEEMINNAQQYNGRSVAYTGEVIGDIMKRGNYAWINVSDGKKTIGVWAEASLIKDIVYAGSYRASGDRVEVIGVFNRACPEHGGDLDIHAREIKKIAPGGPVAEAPDTGKRNVAILLLGTLCLTWILTQFKNS